MLSHATTQIFTFFPCNHTFDTPYSNVWCLNRGLFTSWIVAQGPFYKHHFFFCIIFLADRREVTIAGPGRSLSTFLNQLLLWGRPILNGVWTVDILVKKFFSWRVVDVSVKIFPISLGNLIKIYYAIPVRL